MAKKVYCAAEEFEKYFAGKCKRDPVTQYAWDVVHGSYGKMCGNTRKVSQECHHIFQ